MGWAAAFALGAIVSPPDAVSTTAIAQRLGLPRRVVTILEGESLVNDATALTALRLAIAAAAATATAAFSLPSATFEFVCHLRRWRRDRPGGRLGCRPAGEAAEGSAGGRARLAAGAVCGLDPGRAARGLRRAVGCHSRDRARPGRAPDPDLRHAGCLASGVWQMVIFVLNGLVFILIGLQLPTILGELRATWTPGQLAILGAAVSLTVIVVRMVWVFPATYLPRWIVPGLKERDPSPPPQIVVILGWAGMRGVVSLAAALAAAVGASLSCPRPAPVPDLRGHPGDAGRSGPDAAVADPAARRRRRRQRAARRDPCP